MTRNVKKFLRKIRIGKLFLGASLFFLYSASPSPTEARWVEMSILAEREMAQRFLAQEVYDTSKVSRITDNPVLVRIQKEIVSANPGELRFVSGDPTEYGIRKVKEVNRIDDDFGFAYTVGDGHIFVTTQYLECANGITPFGVQRTNKVYDIYNNSDIAFSLAHEMGHWKNPEVLHKAIRDHLIMENNADKTAWELLDGTSYHGYGGALISFSRNKYVLTEEQIKKDKKHPTPEKRYETTADYVNRVSNGRIKIDINGYCTYDGKPIMLAYNSKQLPIPLNDNKVVLVTQQERTMYVAGQIAFAIKYGVWNMDNLIVTTHDDAFGTKGWNYIVLAVKNPKSGGIKVIDKFFITPERFKVIYKGFLENNGRIMNSLNEEETYFLQLMYYIHTNSNKKL